MKGLNSIAVAVLAAAIFTGSAAAQKKSTTKKPVVKKTAPVAVIPPLDVRAAREKVDVQLSNVNAFLNLFAPIAQSIETADSDARAGRLSRPTIAKVEASKARLVQSIRDLRTGLSNLETEFRTKPALQKYLPGIQGVTDLATQAEDLAIAGRFVAAKAPLRDAVRKLTDILAILPR